MTPSQTTAGDAQGNCIPRPLQETDDRIPDLPLPALHTSDYGRSIHRRCISDHGGAYQALHPATVGREPALHPQITAGDRLHPQLAGDTGAASVPDSGRQRAASQLRRDITSTISATVETPRVVSPRGRHQHCIPDHCGRHQVLIPTTAETPACHPLGPCGDTSTASRPNTCGDTSHLRPRREAP
ncbi:hypothetical protein AVEN_190057-1 [Araneus ventricosus]|uniref:Uncharacterized protein n=1 Tax=Araneus ventricosus TaxID=182803 RepID=A0A4Y2MQQ9_ARAVE|nr:hypothetical protein AVEN_190057-1 [Araneus ventricosus]